MHLLRTKIEGDVLQLETFDSLEKTPPYAILSHTWDSGQEVLFQHVKSRDPSIAQLSGFHKVKRCCERALKDGYDYVWVDTCCIDKTSSAELSEAINSMFMWYSKSQLCYAYLRDASASEVASADGSSFRKSRWFTRGWTLQELIAPCKVRFYDTDWNLIGTKSDLASVISSITGVDNSILRGFPFLNMSIAKRLSWAANRQTSRVEDRAYCLMGLVGVNMPTIYGEGPRAFARLQQEIMARTPDHSIFAWSPVHLAPLTSDVRFQTLNVIRSNGPDLAVFETSAVVASSPDDLADSADIVGIPYGKFRKAWGLKTSVLEFQRTPGGLRMELPVFRMPEGSMLLDSTMSAVAVLACKFAGPGIVQERALGVPLGRTRGSAEYYVRLHGVGLLDVNRLVSMGIPWTVEELYLLEDPTFGSRSSLAVHANTQKMRSCNVTIKASTLERLCKNNHYNFVMLSSTSSFRVNTRPKFLPGQFEDVVIVADSRGVDTHAFGTWGNILFKEIPPAGTSSQTYHMLEIGPVFLRDEAVLQGVEVKSYHSEFLESEEMSMKITTIVQRGADANSGGVHWNHYVCSCGLHIEVLMTRIQITDAGIHHYTLELELDDTTLIKEVHKPETAGHEAALPQELSPDSNRHSSSNSVSSLQWVPGIAGFIPVGALKTYFSGYIARARTRNDCLEPGLAEKTRSAMYSVSYGHDALGRHLECEYLVGPPDSIVFVRYTGKFYRESSQTTGANNFVTAGHDEKQKPFYLVLVHSQDLRGKNTLHEPDYPWSKISPRTHSAYFFGIVKEGYFPRIYGSEPHLLTALWIPEFRGKYYVLASATPIPREK